MTQSAPRFVDRAFVADMTLPFRSLWNISSPDLLNALPARLHAAGLDFTIVTIATDDSDAATAMRSIGEVRAFFRDHADICTVVESVADIERARAEGKLAVDCISRARSPSAATFR